jgi:hypothetical protein
VFEIATQFNAIFRAQTNAQQISVSLLSMWTSRKVHAFMTMLATQLHRMDDSASLRDALDACVFFAASMGRLGADFTAQLPPLFEHKMHDLVVHFWKEGAHQLDETLKVCREAGVASPLSSSATAAAASTYEVTSSTSDGGPMPPPRQLMALPPLGRLANAIVTGLNELRRCLLPGIFSRLRDSLDEVLKEVSQILATNERAVMTPGLRGEAAILREIAKEMKQVMANVVDPYVRGALEFSLGNERLALEFHEKLKEKEVEEPIIEEEEEQIEEDKPVDESGFEEKTQEGETVDDLDPKQAEEDIMGADENWDDDGLGDDFEDE